MELGGGSNNRRRDKAIAGSVLCFCGLPAKISQAWTDKNPGRRFYGCERYKVQQLCFLICLIEVFLTKFLISFSLAER